MQFWPRNAGHGVAASFRLSLPRSAPKAVRFSIGPSTFLVRRGGHVDVSCRSGGAFDRVYHASTFQIQQSLLFRRISVRMTRLAVHDMPAGPAGAGSCSAAVQR
jgi:hypothetical protein